VAAGRLVLGIETMKHSVWFLGLLFLGTSHAATRAQGDAGGADAAPREAVIPEALELAPALRDAHAAGVLAERRAALAEAWAASTDEGREAARAVLLARTHFGPGALLSPPELVLAQATRFLRGDVAPGAPYPAVVAIADALDLRVVPGALEAGRATDAEVCLRWVQPPLHPALPETVELRLAVVTPVPGAKHRVQTCASFVFRPRQLGADSLSVPVSLPGLAAGEHWLACEVAHEGHAVPGFFVPLDVHTQLDGALAARPTPEGSPLDALLRFGVRAEGRGRLAEWFAGDAAAAPRTLGVPSAAALLGVPLDSAARVTVFVDVPPPSDPVDWLAGREGVGWRSAIGADRRVVALRLDLSRGLQLEDYVGTSLGVVASVAAADPDSPRVLVVRGERVGTLLPLLEAPGDLFQGLVIVGAPGQSLPRGWRGAGVDGARPERRTLVVTCLAEEDVPAALGELPAAASGPDGEAAPGPVVRMTRRAPPMVVVAELPRLLQAFVTSVAAPVVKAPETAPAPKDAAPRAK
jgi:hypothetical protein